MAIKRDPSVEERPPFRDTLAITEIKRTTNSTSYEKESDFVNNKLEDAFSAWMSFKSVIFGIVSDVDKWSLSHCSQHH